MLLKILLIILGMLLLSNVIVTGGVTRSNVVRMSETGKRLVEKFEGRVDKVYICPGGKISSGIGHALSAQERQQRKVGAHVESIQIDKWFEEDISKAERVVNLWVAVPLTQGQFDALVSFVFNLGANNFKRSTLLKLLNKGQFEKVAEEFGRWVHSRSKGRMVKLKGLIARRQAERDLFLSQGIVPSVVSV